MHHHHWHYSCNTLSAVWPPSISFSLVHHLTSILVCKMSGAKVGLWLWIIVFCKDYLGFLYIPPTVQIHELIWLKVWMWKWMAVFLCMSQTLSAGIGSLLSIFSWRCISMISENVWFRSFLTYLGLDLQTFQLRQRLGLVTDVKVALNHSADQWTKVRQNIRWDWIKPHHGLVLLQSQNTLGIFLTFWPIAAFNNRRRKRNGRGSQDRILFTSVKRLFQIVDAAYVCDEDQTYVCHTLVL